MCIPCIGFLGFAKNKARLLIAPSAAVLIFIIAGTIKKKQLNIYFVKTHFFLKHTQGLYSELKTEKMGEEPNMAIIQCGV